MRVEVQNPIIYDAKPLEVLGGWDRMVVPIDGDW